MNSYQLQNQNNRAGIRDGRQPEGRNQIYVAQELKVNHSTIGFLETGTA